MMAVTGPARSIRRSGNDALLPLGPLLLSHLGLPFTGCDVGAIATTTDKLVAGQVRTPSDSHDATLAGAVLPAAPSGPAPQQAPATKATAAKLPASGAGRGPGRLA